MDWTGWHANEKKFLFFSHHHLQDASFKSLSLWLYFQYMPVAIQEFWAKTVIILETDSLKILWILN